jgi:histidinol-phosphate phosphatase family protein
VKKRPRAVFIDRDGVLIRDADYLASTDGLSVFKGSPRALKLLREAGFKIVIVTNQSGVARGYFTEGAVRKIHAELRRRLARAGAKWTRSLLAARSRKRIRGASPARACSPRSSSPDLKGPS